MQPVGQPVQLWGVEKETMGYTLPLSQWPAGDYRIQVMVTDRLSGATAYRESDFQIVVATGAPGSIPENSAR